jgi:hypothetical protein
MVFGPWANKLHKYLFILKIFSKNEKKKMLNSFTNHNFFGPWVNKILHTPCTTLNMMMQLTKEAASSLLCTKEWNEP